MEEHQHSNAAEKRKMESSSQREECPAILKKLKPSAGLPVLHTRQSVAGRMRKRPASAEALLESCPPLVKRRKILSQPQKGQDASVNKRCDGTTEKTSVTTSTYMKRSLSESSPCSNKRRKIPDTSPTLEASHSFHENKENKTTKINKKTKKRQAKPQKLSRKERETERLLHQQGVPLFKTSEVKYIASLGTKVLGSGSCGSCHLAVDPDTRQSLVIKKFPRHRLSDLVTEATNLHRLRLPGVQRLVGVCVPSRQMVTGFAGTTLPNYLSLTQPSVADTISVFLQISRTLGQMHGKGISHNDIKGDNFCVQVDNNTPKVTIIDLGLARPFGTEKLYLYSSDTDLFPWLAPELLLHTHACCETSDVYSLAKLLEDELPLENMPGQTPLLAALASWIQRAQNHNPRKRPPLTALIDVLQLLHRDMTWEKE